MSSNWKALVFGGLLPVLAFAFVEDTYGVFWGTIAGMVFGVGELIYEKLTLKRFQTITLASNFLILIMGGISIYANDGVWFKLQPAIMSFAFAIFLFVTSWLKKPLLLEMALKQNPQLPEQAKIMLSQLNFRLGFLFVAITALCVHAAMYWPTSAWAFLKGFGLFIILAVYMLGEVLWRRLRRQK